LILIAALAESRWGSDDVEILRPYTGTRRRVLMVHGVGATSFGTVDRFGSRKVLKEGFGRTF
jgi:hypothetical protein